MKIYFENNKLIFIYFNLEKGKRNVKKFVVILVRELYKDYQCI